MSLIAFLMFLNAFGVDNSPPYAPPEIRRPPSCVCSASSERPDVTFSGYVVDAEVTLGSNRRSVEDRMATIFDVEQSSHGELEGRTRLWHNADPATCGVSFDYGKKYTVAARWSGDELETDKCLMRAAD